MESFKKAGRYLASWAHYFFNLEWSETVQHYCKFCHPEDTFKKIVYQKDGIIAAESKHPAGKHHWLILPEEHIRDIENLTHDHLELLQSMDRVKKHLLAEISPELLSSVHTGYHRGRRPLVGSIFLPDIISVHHLHLHVIVKPRWWLCFRKYPRWFPLMWKSDAKLLREVRRMS